MFHVGPRALGYFMPKEEPLPPRSAFNSPLKKRKAVTQTVINAVIKCDLNPQKKLKPNDGKSFIQATYPEYNLDYINQLCPAYQSQVFGIEQCLKLSSLPPDQKLMIRDKMMHILKNHFSVEGVLVELGILYYFLASDKTIPHEHDLSLLSLRLEAIEREALELKQIHKRSCREEKSADLLPSGCTAYLLRTFVRMIFPPNGGFNLGGCHAIKALLFTRLNLLITEEMRTQILSVVDCLIKDSEFLQLFLNPFKVHSLMQPLISLDLKISPAEEMNFVYVRWSMLTALVSSIGQLHEGNCYAVASAMNLLGTGKKALVKLMIEILTTGHFSFEGKSIPILPLVETRRKYAADFEVEMTIEQAHGLTPYSVAGFALDIPATPSEEIGDEQKSLGDWIDFEFMDTAKTAKELFLSHKLSFLQQAILAAIQFVSQNSFSETSGLGGWRFKIFGDMLEHIEASLRKRLVYPSVANDPDFKKFKDDFHDQVTDHIFLVDYNHSAYTVENGKVVFDFHSQGFIFNSNLKDYEPFKATRRLFHLSQDGFRPLDKLSDFINCCVESLDAVTPPQMKPKVKAGQRLLKLHLTHPSFREDMAKQLAKHNRFSSNLNWQDYDASDSFFLIQRGGKPGLLDSVKAFEGKFTKVEAIDSNRLKDFFLNLCNWSSANFEEEIRKDYNFDPQVLASYTGHVINLTPLRFSHYWKSTDPIAELKARVILPGLRLKKRVLSREEMLRVLRYTSNLNISDEFVDACIEKGQTTVGTFYTKVHEVINKQDQPRFDQALRNVIGEFTFKSLEENLSLILFSLGVDLNFQEYGEFINFLKKSNKSKLLLNPFIAGTLIQKALSSSSPLSIFIPIRKIEEALCCCYKLPECIELGNLNWIGKLSERLDYSYLVLTFDIFTDHLALCKKKGEFIVPYGVKKAKSIYKHIDLYSNTSVERKN